MVADPPRASAFQLRLIEVECCEKEASQWLEVVSDYEDQEPLELSRNSKNSSSSKLTNASNSRKLF